MYSRTHPYISSIQERKLLSGPGSTKKTYHIVLEAKELKFKVGDSIGVIPTNDPNTVDQIIDQLHATGAEPIFDPRTNATHSFRDILLHKANISKVSFHKLFRVDKTTTPLIELVKHYQPHPSELCKVLLPLLPRFYSIASSSKVYPNEVHLTVAHTSFLFENKTYFGVGSHFLCETALLSSTPIPIYVQPSNHFTLPEDPNIPIILIGPGTGVAPFRAFLQERIATQAPGLNWLFFGERNSLSDFYYGEFWLDLEKQGRLRLDTAFSRDQPEKIYVQHKILERKKSLWDWIQKGSVIYVCGDAEKMAKDVDLALQQVFREEGHLSEEDARIALKQLRLGKRYLLDVY